MRSICFDRGSPWEEDASSHLPKLFQINCINLWAPTMGIWPIIKFTIFVALLANSQYGYQFIAYLISRTEY